MTLQASSRPRGAPSRDGGPHREGAGPGTGTLVLGGGFAGLAAGYALVRARREVMVLERGAVPGGLSRTERLGDFLFDLGGHRFHTRDTEVAGLVARLMGEELIRVPRTSQIYLRGRFFDYPLRPWNAVSRLGLPTCARVVRDYAAERLRRPFRREPEISLEDWVVRRFGRTLFEIYFKVYSEKVWGLDCSRISAQWVAQRIRGLSLGAALRNAFTRRERGDVPSLLDRFDYPRRGCGSIAERLREEISARGRVLLDTTVTELRHDGRRVTGLEAQTPAGTRALETGQVVSTIPLPLLPGIMDPPPPDEVLRAAAALKFRDLLLVAVEVDRPSVTDQTWIYLPERDIPFGRIHEPKNWSREMAPPDRTLLVAEYFCQRGDGVWGAADDELGERTVDGLVRLGFLRRGETLRTHVLRVPQAYPLFEVGYERHTGVVRDWLSRFENLTVAGRTGTFAYLNMDHAIRSGLDAAARVLAGSP